MLANNFAAWAIWLVATIIGFTALAANAQTYPTRPVTLIALYSPGSAGDVLARALAKGISDGGGINMVVENKDGASGHIAVTHILNSAPDGPARCAHLRGSGVSDAGHSFVVCRDGAGGLARADCLEAQHRDREGTGAQRRSGSIAQAWGRHEPRNAGGLERVSQGCCRQVGQGDQRVRLPRPVGGVCAVHFDSNSNICRLADGRSCSC